MLTVARTAIDQTAGIVNLTTMLAHASGEWIASDRPVCPVAELASPQRMGAALTYARRYALFTLVGIAGEDDLDAPDLCDSAPSAPRSPDQSRMPPRTAGNGRGPGIAKGGPVVIIDAEQSATIRDRLLADIGNIASAELAASWAGGALAAKNKLAAVDAKRVEDAFEQRLSELAATGASQDNAPAVGESANATPLPQLVVGVRVYPALKHGGYSATGLLPGEDRAAFQKLHRDLASELCPDGRLQEDTVFDIARVMWRKQNRETFRVAEAARERASAIRSEMIPSTSPPLDIPLLGVSSDWSPPDPADVEAATQAAEAQARKELGENYKFVEMGDLATVTQMLADFEVEERLNAMIDKLLKRLWMLKASKTLSSPASSTTLPRISGPKKAA